MSTALEEARKVLPATPWGLLPPRMRLLYITTARRTGGWLAEAFAADSASQIAMEEAVGLATGLARLRDEPFDAVLLSHEPGVFDALEFVDGLRAGGSGEPMLVLGNQSEQEMAALCYQVGADAYVCVHCTTTRTLIWTVARAIERHRLIRENHCLKQAQRQRLQREHSESQRLLQQQRQLVEDLEALRQAALAGDAPSTLEPADSASADEPLPIEPPPELPPQLIAHYRELLRAYVIMGSGNLGLEMNLLAELLVQGGVSPRQTMQLHLHALEELLEGLGSRSSRHVMSRADLLVLELMVHLGEGYRQQYLEKCAPPRQQLLPGFGD